MLAEATGAAAVDPLLPIFCEERRTAGEQMVRLAGVRVIRYLPTEVEVSEALVVDPRQGIWGVVDAGEMVQMMVVVSPGLSVVAVCRFVFSCDHFISTCDDPRIVDYCRYWLSVRTDNKILIFDGSVANTGR